MFEAISKDGAFPHAPYRFAIPYACCNPNTPEGERGSARLWVSKLLNARQCVTRVPLTHAISFVAVFFAVACGLLRAFIRGFSFATFGGLFVAIHRLFAVGFEAQRREHRGGNQKYTSYSHLLSPLADGQRPF
jgi:hypothetical protein